MARSGSLACRGLIIKKFPKVGAPSMFFCLSNRPRAAYLARLMWSMLRLLIAVLIPVGALLAQEQPSPTPAAGASPSPIPAPASEASPSPSLVPAPDASPSPSLVPAPDASPELSPEPLASPSPAAGDVIPMEGGAPLDTKDIAPARTGEAMPDEAYAYPDALIPDEGPVGPPAMPATFESAQEKARQLSIRYREGRVQAEKDPKVISLLDQAGQAKTLEDQRAAMREYYRLLFKKIVSIDKSLAEKCKVMETAYIRRLAQERLEPTIPLNPPPTPEPLN